MRFPVKNWYGNQPVRSHYPSMVTNPYLATCCCTLTDVTDVTDRHFKSCRYPLSMLLFDGESHGSIHSCSFSRRNAVLKQTIPAAASSSTRPAPLPRRASLDFSEISPFFSSFRIYSRAHTQRDTLLSLSSLRSLSRQLQRSLNIVPARGAAPSSPTLYRYFGP